MDIARAVADTLVAEHEVGGVTELAQLLVEADCAASRAPTHPQHKFNQVHSSIGGDLQVVTVHDRTRIGNPHGGGGGREEEGFVLAGSGSSG
jgi:hypothetical protein